MIKREEQCASAMLFDVVEVDIATGKVVQVMARDKDERNAEAVIYFAIARRGVEHSFYKAIPASSSPKES